MREILRQKVRELFEKAWSSDQKPAALELDTSICIESVLKDNQAAEITKMIEAMEKQGKPSIDILADVVHDLHGYYDAPRTFCAKSSEYA